MLYVYDTQTGEYLGPDDRGVLGGNATDLAPPPCTNVTIGFWTGAAWESRPRPELAVQRQARAEALVQGLLDSLAQAWGYDDRRSLVSYRDSGVPRFAAEAAAGVAYRDALWLAAIAYGQAHADDGTPDGLLAALPPPPTRPTP